jgi:hypothetical protein
MVQADLFGSRALEQVFRIINEDWVVTNVVLSSVRPSTRPYYEHIHILFQSKALNMNISFTLLLCMK